MDNGFMSKHVIRISEAGASATSVSILQARVLASKVTRAQRLVRKHVNQGASLVDELISERRDAARNE
jgi:hypothetical protein